MNRLQQLAQIISELTREEMDQIAKDIASRLENSYPDTQTWLHEWMVFNLIYDIRDKYK